VDNNIYLFPTQANPNNIGLRNGPTSSGTNVNPGAGSLVLTGFVPVIALALAISPAVGTLTLTGFAPTVTIDTPVAPNVGTLTLTGFAPTLDKGILPGVGALTFTGFAPSITIDRPVAPALGQLTLSGFSPTVAIDLPISPNVGALVFTGLVPAVTVGGGDTAVTPNVGTLTVVGFAPTITVSSPTPSSSGVGAGIPFAKPSKKKSTDPVRAWVDYGPTLADLKADAAHQVVQTAQRTAEADDHDQLMVAMLTLLMDEDE